MIILNAPPVGIAGEWMFHGVNKFNGYRRPLLDGWSPNLLTTQGRLNIGIQPNWLTSCKIGTDGTPPDVLDTDVKAYLDGTTTVVAESQFSGAETVEPYNGWLQKTWRFDAAGVSRNIAEVTAGWSPNSGSNIVTRANPINPQTGQPTSVTQRADELLDVTYRMRYYAPVGDTIDNVDLDGITYQYTFRAANVTSNTAWGQYIGTEAGAVAGADKWVGYDGVIGDVTSQPTGVADQADNSNQTESAYQNDYTRLCLANVGPQGWVPSSGNGLRSLLCQTTMGQYQIQFDPIVPKTVAKLMGIGVSIFWTQRP